MQRKLSGIYLFKLSEQYFEAILQISKALAATDRKDLMRKLPKFIYDEEKALEVSWLLSLLHHYTIFRTTLSSYL